jgi:bifunctional non-homologous end joining protein LigD
MSERVLVKVDGRELELSNLDKTLYPEAGFTKGEVIDYYTRLAPVILPHLADRPLTRIRYPNGVAAKGFFEKNAPAGTPDWVRTVTLPSPGSTKERELVEYIVCDDLPTLVWLANLAALELHTPQWRIGSAGPDRLIVDLDPGPPAALRECCAVALLMRERLAADGLVAYPKTSGKKGMQLACPISGEQSADEVSAYARRVARELERAHPELILSRMTRSLRPGKVFIDWSQNNAAKTTVSPYSLRAMSVPAVSTPLRWDEVESGKVVSARLTAPAVLKRVEKYGDLMAALCEPGPRVPS